MAKKVRHAISPTREEDYPAWYQQVVKVADLAENSPVRGCMVIKPWGYRIWENIRDGLDKEFRKTGHQNAYFPLFIPLSYLQKEADHVEGFATECAVVTHHRLEKNKKGELVPASPLEEPLIVRPTSETIFGEMYAKWIQSYRDLPVLINQWANVVRWEMRPRIFLRTAEFLWQEGHTAHATKEEAEEETLRMLEVYEKFCHDMLAMPVITGKKTESEKFPGAEDTYCIEAMMHDRKALQAGTSHFLGQNFSKSAGIRFRTKEGGEEHVWTTSWGVTTRLIGGMVMTHSDDDGLVLPPRVASAHVVIIPIIHKEETRDKIIDYCNGLASELKELYYHHNPLEVLVDQREMRGGEMVWSWIKKGAPIRIEVGLRELEEDALSVAHRTKAHKDYLKLSREELFSTVFSQLDDIQANLYQKALAHRNQHTVKIDSEEEFRKLFTPKNPNKPEIHGAFALAHFCCDAEIEEKIKKELNVTVRCIPFGFDDGEGTCIFTGKKSPRRVIFAKAY